MNRKILSLIVIVLCGACSIFAQQPANFGWYSAAIADANAQNKAQTTVYGTKVDNAGYVYTMVSMGSDADTTGDAAATQGHFLGEDMTGAPYSGTSYNNNIMLVKHDFSGNVVWKVYSKNGDVDVSSSDYTPTADGGAFLALKARHTSNNFYGSDILLQIVGNNGTETTLTFSFPDADYHNVYQPVFVKIDADGNIVSAVRAIVDWNPVDNPAANYTWGISDGFSLYGAAQDADRNFFVTGNLRRTMHIGENQILAHNVADWDGGSGFAGSAFVLKLNADLTYNSHIVTGGSSVGETAKMMKYRDGKLYVVGYLKGSNEAVTLGESQITPDDKYSFWTARINASDLSVDYLSLVQGALVSNKNFMQVNALEFAPDNSNFFVAGGIQGGFNVGTDELAAQGTVYAGFVFRCNAATGVADKGFVKQTSGISNNFGLVVNADSVFAYGYNWASSPKSNYFDSFNHNLESSTSYILAESLGSITAWSCAAKGDSLLIATRVQANKALDFGYATEATSYTSTTTWHGVIAEYTFPGYEFTAPQRYDVTLNVGENGSVTTDPETLTGLVAGTEVVFTIVPEEGYELDEFLLDGEAVAVENNTYTLNVTADATVDVTFKLIPVEPETYTIILNVGENGNVTTNPENLESIVEGTNVVFTIVPDEGYELDEFLLDGEVQNVENNEFTLSAIDNDHEVTVSFKLTVAVDMVEGANVEIYSYGNELRIIGAENQDVFVYNLLGQLVDSFAVTSTDEVRTLNAGTYIVKAGVNTVQKIVIR
ncbi:MAG: T9SS type A sorting domain-containing protein [Bacteroidales bacterium]|nr:T9SS type A sorting domain-containing protein [Bacteroidales bacterium]